MVSVRYWIKSVSRRDTEEGSGFGLSPKAYINWHSSLVNAPDWESFVDSLFTDDMTLKFTAKTKI